MAIIIAILISLGLTGSVGEFNSLNEQQQNELTEIVIVEDLDM